MNTFTNQQTNEEELAARAELAVALFAKAIGEDYSEVEARIVSDFRRYQETHPEPEVDPYAGMNEYAEASGKGAARRIVELNQDSVYKLPGDKVVTDFFESVDEMFAPRHTSKEVF